MRQKMPFCVPPTDRTGGMVPVQIGGSARGYHRMGFTISAFQQTRGRPTFSRPVWIFMHRVPHGECALMPRRERLADLDSRAFACGQSAYATSGKSGDGMLGCVLVASRLTLQDRRIREAIGRLAELPGHIG